MDEIIVFLVVLGLIALAIIPIITLTKLFSIARNVENINDSLADLELKIKAIKKKAVSKEDIAELLKNNQPVANKEEEIQVMKEEYTPTKTELKEEIKPEVITQPEIADQKTIVEELLEKPAETNKTEGTLPPPIPLSVLLQQKEEVKNDEPQIKQEEVTVEEKQSYAAAERQAEPIYYRESIESPRSKVKDVKHEEEVHEKSFIERLIGENLLSKIGIVTLVLGIGFFVKYAIDQDWINEVGRVGIGVLTGAIIIGIAHKLKEKYNLFSSILVGGGISVFYITITLAFREYELFNQTVAFVILIAITIFAVLLSLLYDRKELAIFSLLGGFASPLMISTGDGNYIVLFSYILILNSGMLIISLKKNWNIIGIISYSLTLIFFWVWLYRSFEDQVAGTLIFASLFFVQFYLLALIDHFRSDRKMTTYQAILILTNNMSMLLACMYVSRYLEYDIRGISTIILAAFNALVMLILFKKSQVDKALIYTIIAIVMSLVSLAIPIQLRGHVITMFWAAEIVVLLWLWKKSQIKVFGVGFLLISVLTLISFGMDVNTNYSLSEGYLPIIINRIFITGIVVIASFVLSIILIRKEDRDLDIAGVDIKSIITIFKVSIMLLSYIVPFLELNYQVKAYFDADYSTSFRSLVLGVYTTIYIAVLTVIFWRNVKQRGAIFSMLFIAVGMYTLIYSILSTNLRSDIYLYADYPTSYFIIHLIALPFIGLIITYLVRNFKSVLSGNTFSILSYILVILSVIILSVQADNIAIMLFGNADNYNSVLYDVHTFVYPILWGIIAMGLMIWGLKSKEVVLRKISLAFFGLIIVKFYAYDVWRMSQAGRIVSFVILGVILLLVSFLQQKIKVLIKSDKIEDEIIEN